MKNQRWLFGRESYRPNDPIRTSDYEVAALDDSAAKAFVLAHHYSASYPAARFRFGLHRAGRLMGVAVFSHPSNDAVLKVFPGIPRQSVELGRFVLLDEVPGNGETWFLGRCFDLLRQAEADPGNPGLPVVGVISFADPVPRTRADGTRVFPGHLGTIYQAHNGRYTGRSSPRTLHILPDGTAFSSRTAQKVRGREQGWNYAAEILERWGAKPLTETEDATAWLGYWLPRLTRPLRHPGNHRYIWPLANQTAKHLDATTTRLPYPKTMEVAP